MRNLLQIGAGKIGRSFIAQVFNRSGYAITFADIDPNLVKMINESKNYNVIIKGPETDHVYNIKDIDAFHIENTSRLEDAINKADIIAVSVGKNNLISVSGMLARGIKKRYKAHGNDPVDIILAENVRNAAALMSGEFLKYMSAEIIRSYVGFVQTSIGKMVPLTTGDQIINDPLAVYAEPYNDLIVDAIGFKNTIPDVPELNPKKNIMAWIDRKVFIHNLGHSVVAYQSFYSYPEIIYIWEALEKNDIHSKTIDVMRQAARILKTLYPSEFSEADLNLHIEDLIQRFSNKNLGDTIFRVGSDLTRKLFKDDRLMIPIIQAIHLNLPFDLILETWMKGCMFKATDTGGNLHPNDIEFHKKYRHDQNKILKDLCKLDDKTESLLVQIMKDINRNPKM
ncbi:MAG: hypothetical protein K9J30_13945 [Bacteroidales bacterium]|nr:hypothetical protein [Bacteroidales bacterium]